MPEQTGGRGVVKANLDELRDFSTRMPAQTQDALVAPLKTLQELEEIAHREVSEHSSDGGPWPINAPMLQTLETVKQKLIYGINQVKLDCEIGAQLAARYAEEISAKSHESAAKIKAIS
ncbi:hypothetical protein DE4585_02623 [Mycobacteroides salmoniphilum]|uniref:Uncharacterized protein n=1 Tax=Mycobacteroides salmoniphilum TaxID=404941 RepID=A0A4R8S0N3_9MYCO|nr:hypothetical protein [Mycobacteroides salmoniphilum]TDZ82094.1 hypothetical protein DE4585_02623 [Mycobacteroides salmoniphilum]